jgi:hypothetical protein
MMVLSEKLLYAWPFDGKFTLPFEFERKPVAVAWSDKPHNALTGRIIVTFPNGARVPYPDLDMAQRAVDKARGMIW